MEVKNANRTRVNTMVHTIEADRWMFRGVVFCVGMECLFILLDLLFTHFRWISVIELSKIVDMTRERAVGTWLSTVMSFLVGLTLLIIFADLRADNGSKREAGWLILSLFPL